MRREEMFLPNDVALERMLHDDELEAADDDTIDWIVADMRFDAEREREL